jgi:hypothetical protein
VARKYKLSGVCIYLQLFLDQPLYYIGLEVLTAVLMKSSIFWDLIPYSPLKVNRNFGGPICLPLQGQRICHARNNLEEVAGRGDLFLRNVGWSFNGLHSLISQKREFFITTIRTCDRISVIFFINSDVLLLIDKSEG